MGRGNLSARHTLHHSSTLSNTLQRFLAVRLGSEKTREETGEQGNGTYSDKDKKNIILLLYNVLIRAIIWSKPVVHKMHYEHHLLYTVY